MGLRHAGGARGAVRARERGALPAEAARLLRLPRLMRRYSALLDPERPEMAADLDYNILAINKAGRRPFSAGDETIAAEFAAICFTATDIAVEKTKYA